MLTIENIEAAYSNEEWLGFGYLQGRQIALEGGKAGLVSDADRMALEAANDADLTGEELFYWLNSKNGRWYADCQFGSNGMHAERYLPGQPQL